MMCIGYYHYPGQNVDTMMKPHKSDVLMLMRVLTRASSSHAAPQIIHRSRELHANASSVHN
eukprot:364180-Chlamydomonas_euryale.AAC.13